MKSSEFAGTGILAAPSARRKAHVSTWHGIELADDFAWLRAENWQEVMREPERLDPEIRAYLDAENAYTNSVMAPTQPLQDTLFDEMKGRIKEDDSTIPAPDGRFAYYIRYREGGQYPLFCRCPSENAASEDAARRETVLLDGGGRQVLFCHRRRCPFQGPPLSRLWYRRRRIGALHLAGPRC